MSSAHTYSLQIAVQWIGLNRHAGWRVIAYVGRQMIGTADFSSAKSLLQAFQCAIPNFDHRVLVRKMEESETPTVFTAEMELSYQQLRLLGIG
jgi:hypothetical protein